MKEDDQAKRKGKGASKGNAAVGEGYDDADDADDDDEGNDDDDDDAAACWWAPLMQGKKVHLSRGKGKGVPN